MLEPTGLCLRALQGDSTIPTTPSRQRERYRFPCLLPTSPESLKSFGGSRTMIYARHLLLVITVIMGRHQRIVLMIVVIDSHRRPHRQPRRPRARALDLILQRQCGEAL